MVRFTGPIATLLAFAMVLGRLSGLIDGTAWWVPVLAAALAGAVVSGIGAMLKLRPATVAAIHLVGLALLVLRVAATAAFGEGIIPDSEALSTAWTELGYGLELLQYGAAPVLAVPGLIALVAMAVWALSAWATASLTRNSHLWALAPLVVFYLQLATIDRIPGSPLWTVGLVLVTAAMVLTMGERGTKTVGRFSRLDGQTLPRRSSMLAGVTLTVLAAVGMVAPVALGDQIPEAGSIRWRASTGLGGLYGGGTALNPFVGLHQSVVSLSDEPMFIATLSDSAPPAETLYWNLITLDQFDGTNWLPSALPTYKNGAAWEDPNQRFQGPSVRVSSRVRVLGLGGQILPTLYSPIALESPVDRISEGFLVRSDGAVRLDLALRPEWEYEFQADVPQPNVAALASVNGALTPLFQEAVDREVSDLGAWSESNRWELADRSFFLRLPDRLPKGIGDLAGELTQTASTDFERAVILEAFFRDSELFTYSTDVSTGHSSLDLEDWLIDPGSRNFRTGYCEQFATAMAVLARTIDVPSRVVLGFTPGEATTQPDGSELIVVRERNAHSWVELWMDGQGWVRFDPTPRSDGVNPSLAQTELGFDPRSYVPAPAEPNAGASGTGPDRPLNIPDVDVRDIGGGTSDGFGTTLDVPGWAWWVGALVLALTATPAAKWFARRTRLARLRHGDISAAWEEITVRLTDLGEPMMASVTPLELANEKGAELHSLALLVTASVSEGSVRGDVSRAFAEADAWVGARSTRGRRFLGWFAPRRFLDRLPGD